MNVSKPYSGHPSGPGGRPMEPNGERIERKRLSKPGGRSDRLLPAQVSKYPRCSAAFGVRFPKRSQTKDSYMAANPSPFDFTAPSSAPLFVAPEPFVSAERVAAHLDIERRQVLNLTRSGRLPAHPMDPTAVRKVYRYKLSEIDAAISGTQKTLAPSGISRNNATRQPRDQRGRLNG